MNNNMHDIIRVMESASKAEGRQRFYEFVKANVTESGQFLNNFTNHGAGTHHDFAWCTQAKNGEKYDRDTCSNVLKSISDGCDARDYWKLEKNDPEPGAPNFVITHKDPVTQQKTIIASLTYFEEKRPIKCSGWAFDIIPQE